MQNADLALLLDRFMRKLHFGLQAKAPKFDKEGIGASNGIILLTIADMGCPGMQELTTRVARDKSQMTRAIRVLETKGLVSRQASPSDARVTLISLTGEGKALVKRLQAVITETIDEILEPIPEADKELLRDLMERAVGAPSDACPEHSNPPD